MCYVICFLCSLGCLGFRGFLVRFGFIGVLCFLGFQEARAAPWVELGPPPEWSSGRPLSEARAALWMELGPPFGWSSGRPLGGARAALWFSSSLLSLSVILLRCLSLSLALSISLFLPMSPLCILPFIPSLPPLILRHMLMLSLSLLVSVPNKLAFM